jgi:hypothetical protein
MTQTSKGFVAGIAIAAAVVAVALVVFAIARSDRDGMMNGYRGGYGPGMMNGYSGGSGYGPETMSGHRGAYGPGMMGGGYGGVPATSPARSASAADLKRVRDNVDTWLHDHGFKGLQVGEVMAFANNDCLAVKDTSGRGAFELLSAPRGQWLMPEPGPNMMWNTHYGMMRGFR